jgi:hypothetical protein
MLVVKGKLVCLGQKLERKSTSFCPVYSTGWLDRKALKYAL